MLITDVALALQTKTCSQSHMMGIACIGWGSLIWQPKSLPISGEWHPDGPMLRVEFLRHSGGERLTLVLSDAAPPVQTLWALLDVESLEGARAALRQREGTKSEWIGYWPSTSPTSQSTDIASWAASKCLSGVVWTDLPTKWNDQLGEAPTLAQALVWLRNLGEQSDAAREYIERAPASIRTPYREAFERELGWLPQP